MKLFIKVLILMSFVSSCNSRIDCNLDLEYKDGITFYKGKLFSGDCSSFYLNGNKMNEQSYLNGKDNGVWTFYYENGRIETKAIFLDNKRDGQWKYFYENGSIKQISYYKNGLKDSIWKKFDESGEVEWEKSFKEDKIMPSSN